VINMELSELYEGVGEWESESEAAEARGRGNVRRPSSQPSFKPRPPPGTPQYVTQAQLEAAMTRSDGKIKTVADGVTQINTRLNSLAVAARREADERKKTLDAQNKDINQKLQLMAMLPVLSTPPSVPVKDIANNVLVPNVLVPDTSSLNKLLPLLLVTGMGGAGGFGGGSDSSGDGGSGMMMMALVLALAK
jgi:hypothetical protein